MLDTAVNRILRGALWLENHRMPRFIGKFIAWLVYGKFIAWAVYGAWWCKLTGRHDMVRKLPFCFRCMEAWPTWEQSPGPRLRPEGKR